MDFELSDRCVEFQERVQAFMDERIYPAEPIVQEQVAAADTPGVRSLAALCVVGCELDGEGLGGTSETPRSALGAGLLPIAERGCPTVPPEPAHTRSAPQPRSRH
jgi:hypothetical protein